jgi:hypothetical protein
MRVGMEAMESIADYLRTGEKTRASDMAFAFIWKAIALSIQRNQSGSI